MTDYKRGDWVFYEFELVQIHRTENGQVKEIADDGWFTISGQDLSSGIVPLTLENKLISNEVKSVYDDLYKTSGTQHLNWPDIHSKFVDLWLVLCDKQAKKERVSYSCIHDLRDKIVAATETVNNICVDGIKLLRQ